MWYNIYVAFYAQLLLERMDDPFTNEPISGAFLDSTGIV